MTAPRTMPTPSRTPAPKFLTQAELASVFGVPRQQVARWQRAGCPCYDVTPEAKRHFFRYSVQEVADWLKSRTAARQEAQA